jgi:hypothetical protein
MWKARFTKNDIVPTLIKAAARFVVVNESGKRLPSMCDGPISIFPNAIGHG